MIVRNSKGFSLIELMIVVVIVGILAAIAMPSYNNYLVRSARSSAQTELLEMASLQERIFLNASNYTPNITGTYNGTAAANNSAAIGGLGRTSGQTRDGRYDLSMDITVPSQTYSMRARPVAGSAQAGDGCLLIQENGVKQWHVGADACDAATPSSW